MAFHLRYARIIPAFLFEVSRGNGVDCASKPPALEADKEQWETH